MQPFRVASKRSFLRVREREAPSLALRLANMVGYLQENLGRRRTGIKFNLTRGLEGNCTTCGDKRVSWILVR